MSLTSLGQHDLRIKALDNNRFHNNARAEEVKLLCTGRSRKFRHIPAYDYHCSDIVVRKIMFFSLCVNSDMRIVNFIMIERLNVFASE